MTYFEVGIPTRKIVNDEEYEELIKKYNGLKNIYRTVCDYNEVLDNKVVPDSIILDKVFFDFDGDDAINQVIKVHEFLKQKRLRHDLRFSGRGFHVFIYLKNYEKLKHPKCCLNNIHHLFINAGFDIDKQIVGDISRLARTLNTFNIKGGLYCIPINENDLKEGLEFIKEKAKKQCFKHQFYGVELFDAMPYDNGMEGFKPIEVSDDIKIKIDKDDLLKTFPLCIANMLIEGELKYRQRFYTISYLVNKGYTRGESFKILETYLKPERYKHIIKNEAHVKYLFKKDALFPSCKQIKNDGYCPIKEQCVQIKELYR